jgi:hypothetical protein
MSYYIQNEEKSPAWGGPRVGAGRPKGRSKAKVCISVSAAIWRAALSSWNGKASRLVENLLFDYVQNTSATPATTKP